MARAIYVNARFVTQPLTGVQRYAYEVARRLPNVRLIAPPGCRSDYAELVQHGSFTSRPRRWLVGGMGGHLWEQLALPRLLPEAALLWSPGGAGPLSVREQVLTIHDVAHLEHPEWYRRSFAMAYGYLLPRLVNRVKLIVTISNYSKQRIISVLRVPAERIVVENPGIDEQFRPLSEDQVHTVLGRYAINRPFILAVGAISPRKNIEGLFQAWAMVAPTLHDVELVVVGQAGLSFSRHSLSEVPSRTTLLGRVSDADLVALYNAAIAFIYPSLYEGFGLPPLEAMACGCPVVCSDNTSLPEAVGDAALLVDPFDTQSIADGLAQIIGDSMMRESLRDKGWKRASLFHWDKTTAGIAAVLGRAAEA